MVYFRSLRIECIYEWPTVQNYSNCIIQPLSYLFQIGVVIEDKEFLESSMDGQPWKAGKFSYSLRCSLWSEHLGLHAGEVGNF